MSTSESQQPQPSQPKPPPQPPTEPPDDAAKPHEGDVDDGSLGRQTDEERSERDKAKPDDR